MKAIARASLILGLLAPAVLLVAGGAAGLVQASQCGPGSVPLKAVCACGDTVVGDYVFPADLTCGDDPGESVDGLIVSSAASVDLNGFRLSGTGNQGTGLRLLGTGGAVDGGRIQNFLIGILASSVITDWTIGTGSPLNVTSNVEGIRLFTNGATITDTSVTSNVSDGVILIGNDNEVSRITCSKNGGTGLFVDGDDNILSHNRCERNGEEGLHVRGDNNTLVRNLGGSNSGDGVHVSGTGNVLETNQGRNNAGDGVRGVGDSFTTNGRNYGAGNGGGANCLIDGFTPTGGGHYC